MAQKHHSCSEHVRYTVRYWLDRSNTFANLLKISAIWQSPKTCFEPTRAKSARTQSYVLR